MPEYADHFRTQTRAALLMVPAVRPHFNPSLRASGRWRPRGRS
jgi:hypothetical protein